MIIDPFSEQLMGEIFKVDTDSNQLNIISRESTTLEFKESFGWASFPKYAKTMAAFSNTQGGYIVFGIKNKPHIPVGLDEKKLEIFNSIDPERITNSLNQFFSPEINWRHAVYNFENRKFGIIYTYQSLNKPVVCIQNKDDFKESDIYYRYRGRSQRIKYPELRKLIEEVRLKEERLWLHHIRQIASIGVSDVGIFNFKDGTTTSGNGGKFIIDENLLPIIKFIKEGEFNEKKGAPAIKIIGHADGFSHIISTQGRPKIIHAKGIRLQDIVIDFLNQNKIPCPKEYIAQICCETTGLLPIYFYQKIARMTTEEVLKHIESITSRAQGKAYLRSRLIKHRSFYKPLQICDTEAGRERKKYLDLLDQEGKIIAENGNDVKRICECVTCLSKEQIKRHEHYLRDKLKYIFNNFYENSSSNISSSIRSAICWLDEALFLDA